ncbi:MAG: DUF3795 domain-containing protein [Endomicrobiales bacterium]
MLPLAFCGNDCNYCPRYLATKSGSSEQLQKVAKLWSRLGLRDTVLLPDEIACWGCSPENYCRYGIRQCPQTSKTSSCGQCAKYPCDKAKRSFASSQEFARTCKALCSQEEYEQLHKAFFLKKKNLNKENQ